MKRLIVIAMLCGIHPAIQAQEDEIRAEVMEWVVEPCLEVAAAFGVIGISDWSIGQRIMREHLVMVLIASQTSNTQKDD